jgi:hypothetical protein
MDELAGQAQMKNQRQSIGKVDDQEFGPPTKSEHGLSDQVLCSESGRRHQDFWQARLDAHDATANQAPRQVAAEGLNLG